MVNSRIPFCEIFEYLVFCAEFHDCCGWEWSGILEKRMRGGEEKSQRHTRKILLSIRQTQRCHWWNARYVVQGSCPSEVPFVFVLKLALRIKKSAESHLILKGYLHVTGTTFRSCASSARIPVVSLSVFVYVILPENLVMPERVIPTLVHPRFLHLEESYIPVQNLATSFMKSKKDHSFFSLAEGSACVNFHKFKLRKFRQEIKKSFRYGPRTCASFFV